jgi:hypothetical protein
MKAQLFSFFRKGFFCLFFILAMNDFSFAQDVEKKQEKPYFAEWTNGLGNSLISTPLFGLGRKTENLPEAYLEGQITGDALWILIGIYEVFQGGNLIFGGGVLNLTGIGATVGVPASLAGMALAGHGIGVIGTSVSNLADSHQRLMAKKKGKTKNSKHANQKAKESAAQKLEEVKKEYELLKAKTKKTKEDNERLEQLKRQMKHYQDKKDFSGENHSQKAKK